MITRLASGVLLLAAMFTGTASAQQFPNGTYTITGGTGLAGHGGPVVLEGKGTDGKGDGIYTIKRPEKNTCLSVANANVGTATSWSRNCSLWILHKNSNASPSAGWSIIAKGDGANCLARVNRTNVLQRNVGGPGGPSPDQLWEIKPFKQ